MKLSEELAWRGLVHSVTDEKIYELLDNESVKFYIGLDSTAPSYHIGNLASLMFVHFFKKHGHQPYIILGGATTRVGDPKATNEREMISEETIDYNRTMQEKQIRNIVDATILDNYDWFKNYSYLDFLRDIGKYFNVAYMINKDTVKRRLDSGISYTEFSYQLVQGYDFAHLNKEHGVTLQIGGQDQWGNITSGIELMRKHPDYEKEAYGLTTPLILKPDGTKYGKTEDGAVWLDKTMTKVYDFYQYFINIPDESVLMFLKRFTMLSKEEIEEVYAEFEKAPHLRHAQKVLAAEVTKMVHGEAELESAIRISEALFTSDLSKLSNSEIEDGFSDVYVGKVSLDTNIVDLLVDNKLVSSKREAREFISNGAIKINNEKVDNTECNLSDFQSINDKYYLVKRGKKKYYLFDF